MREIAEAESLRSAADAVLVVERGRGAVLCCAVVWSLEVGAVMAADRFAGALEQKWQKPKAGVHCRHSIRGGLAHRCGLQ